MTSYCEMVMKQKGTEEKENLLIFHPHADGCANGTYYLCNPTEKMKDFLKTCCTYSWIDEPFGEKGKKLSIPSRCYVDEDITYTELRAQALIDVIRQGANLSDDVITKAYYESDLVSSALHEKWRREDKELKELERRYEKERREYTADSKTKLKEVENKVFRKVLVCGKYDAETTRDKCAYCRANGNYLACYPREVRIVNAGGL